VPVDPAGQLVVQVPRGSPGVQSSAETIAAESIAVNRQTNKSTNDFLFIVRPLNN